MEKPSSPQKKSPDIHDDDGVLLPGFVRAMEQAIDRQDWAGAKTLVSNLHESDFADLIECLHGEKRAVLIGALGTDLDLTVLPELEQGVRDDVIDTLPNTRIAEAVRSLKSDDAVTVLEDLDEDELEEILEHIPVGEREALKRSLDYPDDSAGRMMQTEYVAFHAFMTVGQAIRKMRSATDLPPEFSAIYVVTPIYHLQGIVTLARLLCATPETRLEQVMDGAAHSISVLQDQEDVARTFERYNLIAAPVVDSNGRLVGVITVDDVVEVISEEAEEDIHALGGVTDESLSDTVLETTKSRFVWLAVNLLTAIMASSVIQLFGATIEQMVALAVLMPIVASMGGNAATQTMTVAVRAIATKSLGVVNARRIIMREVLVGGLNGLIFALIMGLVTLAWFGNAPLGLVIAAAMLFNLLVAGLAGISIPLLLEHYGIDPAIASSVFVTTVTDVIGFLAFLGLAALVLV